MPRAVFDRVTQVQVGMQVVGSDKRNVGLVKEVRDDDFLVDIPMHRDLDGPVKAGQNVGAGLGVLNFRGHQVNQMNWPRPSLL